MSDIWGLLGIVFILLLLLCAFRSYIYAEYRKQHSKTFIRKNHLMKSLFFLNVSDKIPKILLIHNGLLLGCIMLYLIVILYTVLFCGILKMDCGKIKDISIKVSPIILLYFFLFRTYNNWKYRNS